MNDFLYTALQGIVQGLTEFLPISSSGHLEFFRHVTGAQSDDHLFFSVLLHLGTLLAVLIVYRTTIGGMLQEVPSLCGDIVGGRFRGSEMQPRRRLLVMVILASLPLPLVLVFNKIGDLLVGLVRGSLLITALCFMVSGVLMFLASRAAVRGVPSRLITARIALIIGVAQAFAGGFSGISRSGTTIAVALLLGLHKETAVNFSFLIGIPAILAAAAYEILKAVQEGGGSQLHVMAMILGIVISAAVGVFAIQLLRLLVKKNQFHWFGIYCFVIGFVSLIIGIVELAGK